MKPAKQKFASQKSRSPLFWVSRILLPIILILCVAWLADSIYDRQAEREDDIKFAKIEIYVDLIKKQLDREIPEGKWTIEKDCHKPGTKGSFEEYSCQYSVTSNSEIDFKQQFASSIQAYFHIQPVEVISDHIIGYERPDPDSGCNARYNRSDNDYSAIVCSSGSHQIRYPLVQW